MGHGQTRRFWAGMGGKLVEAERVKREYVTSCQGVNRGWGRGKDGERADEVLADEVHQLRDNSTFLQLGSYFHSFGAMPKVSR